MPLAAIAAIASIAAAGTGIGTTLYNLTNQPSTPTPPTPSTTPTPLTGSQNASQTAAVAQQLPNIQAAAPGASPEYYAQQASTLAGTSNDPQSTGNIQAALNQFFNQNYGFAAPGTTGLTPSGTGGNTGTGIIDLLSKPLPSPLGGGGNPAGSDFVSSILNSDTFKGLAA